MKYKLPKFSKDWKPGMCKFGKCPFFAYGCKVTINSNCPIYEKK